MTEISALWDFDDPGASEHRFRVAAESAGPREAMLLSTQVARALGLQERYAEAHELLDALAADDAEVATRVLLERGRLRRSAGAGEEARPLFEAAGDAAHLAGLDALEVDARHMVALVAPADDQVALVEQALTVARASSDPVARSWEPSLLNNLGMTHAEAGDWPAALTAFEAALAGRQAQDDAGRTRVARWMVAWTLRHLGRTFEALALQRGLRAELDAAGEDDPYVDEEIALLGG